MPCTNIVRNSQVRNIQTFCAFSLPIHAEISLEDKFELWDRCRPVGLVVHVAPDLNSIRKAYETTIRSRLRVAHLYAESGVPYGSYVWLLVYRAKTGVSLKLEYRKLIIDPIVSRDYADYAFA